MGSASGAGALDPASMAQRGLAQTRKAAKRGGLSIVVGGQATVTAALLSGPEPLRGCLKGGEGPGHGGLGPQMMTMRHSITSFQFASGRPNIGQARVIARASRHGRLVSRLSRP